MRGGLRSPLSHKCQATDKPNQSCATLQIAVLKFPRQDTQTLWRVTWLCPANRNHIIVLICFFFKRRNSCPGIRVFPNLRCQLKDGTLKVGFHVLTKPTLHINSEVRWKFRNRLESRNCERFLAFDESNRRQLWVKWQWRSQEIFNSQLLNGAINYVLFSVPDILR